MGCTDITSPAVPEAWIPGNYGDDLEKGLVESQTLSESLTQKFVRQVGSIESCAYFVDSTKFQIQF